MFASLSYDTVVTFPLRASFLLRFQFTAVLPELLALPVQQVLALLSWNPAAIAGVADRHGRPVAVGEPANLTVFDPTAEWTVVPANLASKSRNTPYAGRTVRGKVRHTVFNGDVVVESGVATR